MARTKVKETQLHDALREKIEAGGGAKGNQNQITKLGVVATPEAPKIIEIEIEETLDFNRGTPIEVLKFIPGEQNVVTTLCEFDNADASDFEPDPMVEFDGTMHLKTQHVIPMKDEGLLGEGRLWSAPIDLSQFKVIEKIEVNQG